MRKLFIIGNGFDLFHRMPTTYNNLRAYFRQPLEYHDWLGVTPDAYYMNPFYIMDQMIMEAVFKQNDVEGKRVIFVEHNSSIRQRVLLWIEKRKGHTVLDKSFIWRDFEESLGRVDFSPHLDDYSGAPLMERAFDCLQSSFNQWIASIDTTKIIPDKNILNLFDCENDIFLTFNYTATLEDIYKIQPQNIRHIHGMSGKGIVFGHSGLNEEEFLQLNSDPELINTAARLFHKYTKNVEKIIDRNKDFFRRVDDSISDIYVYGFSFSSCDLRYIYEICHSAKMANWHFNSYETEEARTRYRDIIRRFGASGKICTYNLPSYKYNKTKPERYGFGRAFRGLIRVCVFKIDAALERAIFGFDPKNERQFFRKPYHKSVKSALIIAAIFLYWIIAYPIVGIWISMNEGIKKLWRLIREKK